MSGLRERLQQASCRAIWREAEAMFRKWQWTPATDNRAVIYSKSRVMSGGRFILVVLGKGVRWQCTACKRDPDESKNTSLHWTNYGRVPLHMALHHGERVR